MYRTRIGKRKNCRYKESEGLPFLPWVMGDGFKRGGEKGG
jgi:hypothetical protein